jgi:hypothetical protein
MAANKNNDPGAASAPSGENPPEETQAASAPAVKTVTVTKKKYVALEDFEGNVGLAVVKIKKDSEIKDEHLALTLLGQDLPIAVTDESANLRVTNPDKYDENGNLVVKKPEGKEA